MVGGDEDVVERCRPVFATYADPIVHLGPLGSGQVTKILNNLLFTANLGSAMSTLELGESLGIPRDRLVRGAQPRVRHQQGARQHRRVRRHPGGARADRRGAAAEGRPARGEPRRRRVGTRGCGVRRGRRRAEVDGPSRDDDRVGFVGAGRMGAPMVRRLVEAGHEVRALGRTAEKRAAVERTGRAAGDRPGRRRRRRRRRRRLRVHRRPGASRSAWTAVWSPRWRRARCSSSTPPAARAPPRRSPRARTASTWSTRRSAAVRTTSPRAR